MLRLLWHCSCQREECAEPGFVSTPFHDGFGLQTVNGIAKPGYRGMQLLHGMGDVLLPAASTMMTDCYLPSNEEGSCHSTAAGTVEVLASTIGTSQNATVQLLLSNFNPRTLPAPEAHTVSISVKNLLQHTASQAKLYRVDDDHCNPIATWNAQGSPEYPTTQQINVSVLAALCDKALTPSGSIGSTRCRRAGAHCDSSDGVRLYRRRISGFASFWRVLH